MCGRRWMGLKKVSEISPIHYSQENTLLYYRENRKYPPKMQGMQSLSIYLSIYMYVCMYMYLILWNLFYNISLITSVLATVVSAGSKRLFCQYKKYFHLIETMVLYSGVW